MIRPREMVHPLIHLIIRISRTFCPEFPNGPVFPMLIIEKFDKFVVGISISTLRIRAARARSYDDLWGYITEVKIILWVPRKWKSDDLAEY